MPGYVGFLRAINVGGRVVKMERLRAILTEAGFGQVETYIASGNVIFSTPDEDLAAIEERIEQRLKAGLGYGVETFVRSTSELIALVDRQPFEGEPIAGNALQVGFLRKGPDVPAVNALDTDMDEFRVVGREVYWLCQTKISESKVSTARLSRALGGPFTFRNITTLQKIATKHGRE